MAFGTGGGGTRGTSGDVIARAFGVGGSSGGGGTGAFALVLVLLFALALFI